MQDGKKTIEKPWQQYLRDHVDENLHAMMKRNVLLATRNFQHRVETFRKEIIFGQNNPMKVRHISYRVEFQGRGAAHIHGVLWLDLNEIKVEGVHNGVLKESYSKLKNSQPLEPAEVRALERFTDTFVTCTRCVSVAGAQAVKIAEETNWHGHSNSCRKGGARLCRWKFPRYPLERTIFVDANRDEVEPRLDAKVREEILDRVMRVLVQEEGGKKVLSKRVEKIMVKYPNVKEVGEEKTSASKEDEESDDSLQMSISAESQNLQQSLQEDPSSEDEHPNTPSPRHFLPDDSSSLQIPISAETSTLQQSFPDDPSSQDHHPRTPSPHHFLPDDLCSEFEADAVHSSSGDGAVELGWPLEPDYALPSSCEEPPELASPLPDRSPLDPEAFCMKFFQVIKKQSCIIKFIYRQNKFGALSPFLFVIKNTLKSQSLMNLPLFRCPLTTSALPKLTRQPALPQSADPLH